MSLYEYECECGEITEFEYDGVFDPGNGWDDPGSGPEFEIKNARECVTVENAAAKNRDPEDACDIDDKKFDERAYEAFADWWHKSMAEAAYYRGYDD